VRGLFLGLSVIVASLPGGAWADEAPCTAPAGEFASWSDPAPLNSANYVSQLPEAQLLPGQTIELGLHPVDAVKFPVAPGKPGGNGGLVELTIAEAGTYRVALGTGAWIDLVRDGKAIESSAHGHGSICGVRKIVEFPLQPGKYVLALSANLELRSQVLVAKAPAGAAPLHP
jgi:hypothetical protein